MQDIVYKLVPGLQEGKFTYDATIRKSICKTLILTNLSYRIVAVNMEHPMSAGSYFILSLLSCSGDKEAEGILSEAGHGGARRYQRRSLQPEDSS